MPRLTRARSGRKKYSKSQPNQSPIKKKPSKTSPSSSPTQCKPIIEKLNNDASTSSSKSQHQLILPASEDGSLKNSISKFKPLFEKLVEDTDLIYHRKLYNKLLFCLPYVDMKNGKKAVNEFVRSKTSTKKTRSSRDNPNTKLELQILENLKKKASLTSQQLKKDVNIKETSRSQQIGVLSNENPNIQKGISVKQKTSSRINTESSASSNNTTTDTSIRSAESMTYKPEKPAKNEIKTNLSLRSSKSSETGGKVVIAENECHTRRSQRKTISKLKSLDEKNLIMIPGEKKGIKRKKQDVESDLEKSSENSSTASTSEDSSTQQKKRSRFSDESSKDLNKAPRTRSASRLKERMSPQKETRRASMSESSNSGSRSSTDSENSSKLRSEKAKGSLEDDQKKLKTCVSKTPKDSKFTCDSCSAIFKTNDELQLHNFRHEDIQELKVNINRMQRSSFNESSTSSSEKYQDIKKWVEKVNNCEVNKLTEDHSGNESDASSADNRKKVELNGVSKVSGDHSNGGGGGCENVDSTNANVEINGKTENCNSIVSPKVNNPVKVVQNILVSSPRTVESSSERKSSNGSIHLDPILDENSRDSEISPRKKKRSVLQTSSSSSSEETNAVLDIDDKIVKSKDDGDSDSTLKLPNENLQRVPTPLSSSTEFEDELKGLKLVMNDDDEDGCEESGKLNGEQTNGKDEALNEKENGNERNVEAENDGNTSVEIKCKDAEDIFSTDGKSNCSPVDSLDGLKKLTKLDDQLGRFVQGDELPHSQNSSPRKIISLTDQELIDILE